MEKSNIKKNKIKDICNNYEYRLMVIGSVILSIFLVNKLSVQYSDMSVGEVVVTMIQIAFNIVLFGLPVGVVCSEMIITEKMKGRIEYYLANQIEVLHLKKEYAIGSFSLCMLPLLIYNIGIYLFGKGILKKVIFSIEYVMFIVAMSVMMFFMIHLLSTLILIIKRIDIIKAILVGWSPVVIILAGIPIQLVKSDKLVIRQVGLLNTISVFCLLLGLSCAIIGKILCNRMNKERVVLSNKE